MRHAPMLSMMAESIGSDFFRWLIALRMQIFDDAQAQEDSRLYRHGPRRDGSAQPSGRAKLGRVFVDYEVLDQAHRQAGLRNYDRDLRLRITIVNYERYCTVALISAAVPW